MVALEDPNGRIRLEIMITKDGRLMLRSKRDAECYYLNPHEDGGHISVSVYCGICSSWKEEA
jgi:hypothetical protein